MRTGLVLLLVVAVVAPPLLYKQQRNRDARNLRTVTDGVLYRSGQMTPAGFDRAVREYGIRTIISLRDSYDEDKPPPDLFEERYAAEHGLAFHRLSPARWSAPDGSVPAIRNVAEFVQILKSSDTRRPILLHCFAGVHRTGAYTAVYRMEYDGWPAAEAVREMRAVAGPRATFEPDVLGFLAAYPSLRQEIARAGR